MTELDQLIQAVYQSGGGLADVNKFYATLLRSRLYMPIEPDTENNTKDPDEPYSPLFIQYESQFFTLAFDTLARLQEWAGDLVNDIGYVDILGRELIRNLGEQVYLVLNFGSPSYKEFSPEEIKHLKSIVAKLDSFAAKGQTH